MSPSSNPSGSTSSSSSCSSPDAATKWYGHEETATTAARYIMHLFHCPNIPATSSTSCARPPLANFVAYALYRTQLPPSVTTCALLLLSRLKARYPSARGSSGHRLFISAFMMSSKMNCDDTYSNKSWAIVAQNMFPLKEINQMEREMLGYLEWNVDVAYEQMCELQYTLDHSFNTFRATADQHKLATSPHLVAPRPSSSNGHSAAAQHQLPTPSSSTTSSPMSMSVSAPPSTSHSPAFQSAPHPHHSSSSGAQDTSYPSPPYSPCASLDFSQSSASTPASSNSSPYECKTPPNAESNPAVVGHHSKTASSGSHADWSEGAVHVA